MHRYVIAFVIAAVLIPASAFGQGSRPSVFVDAGQLTDQSVTLVNGAWQVYAEATTVAGSIIVRIRPESMNTRIAFVLVRITGNPASSVVNIVPSLPNTSISYLGQVSRIDTPFPLWSTTIVVDGELAGPVTLQSINRITVRNGSVTGPITSTGNSNGSPAPGSIGTIQLIDSELRGSVTANGAIILLDASGSDIGATGTVSITANQAIQTIRARNINANISAPTLAGVSSNNPDGITATGSISGSLNFSQNVDKPISISGGLNAPVTIGGNLTSTLTAASLNADLRVNETLSGSLTLTGGLPAARTIRIGDGFSGTITLPGTASLAGQITINADQKAPTGTWTGTVSIGTNPNPVVTLSAPPDGKYTQLPASLGGGSVGLASFRLHEPACTPPHNAVAVGQGLADGAFGTGLFPVRIRHYGPVKFVGSARPTVQARVSESDPCQWIDLAGFAFRGPGDAGWTDPNSIGVGAANGVLIKQGIYRVIFNSGTLVSDVTNSPDVVWPVVCDLPSYVFRVFCDSNLDLVDDSTQSVACTTDCYRVDFNGNGFVSPTDIFDFLNAYFNPATPVSTIDFDNNGVKGPSDIFAYLNAYFGCPK